MKTARLSLTVTATLFAGLTLCPLVRADDASRRAAAEELLALRHTGDMVNNAARQMADNTDRISDGMAKQAGAAVNPQEFSAKLKAEARAIIEKDLNWEAMKPAFIDAYSQAFTEEEMQQIIAFYQSPAGQKLVAEDPQILGKLEKVSREKTMGVMPRVVQRLREMVVAVNPAAATSGPGGMAPPLPPGLKIPPSPPPGLMPPPAPPGVAPVASPTPTFSPVPKS